MLLERQKALLALVEALGGQVPRTDMQKLLFLWMQSWKGGDPPFDFVPHRFGAFSYTSYADWTNLVRKGLLRDDAQDWAITPAGRDAIRKQDRLRGRARTFVERAPTARGDELVALTYHRAPFFAIRSEIVQRVLAGDTRALQRIEEARPAPGPPGITTIGYEGRSLESYLVTLLEAGVTLLCDVRRNPVSRRYGFARSTLSRACEGVGLRYEHLPELGIASSERQDLHTQADYDALFALYERETLPSQGAALGHIADRVRSGERVALTCCERLPQQRHRRCVADALSRDLGPAFAPTHI